MVLYAKSLGASATLLGLIASLTPLLAVFQIPAAHFLPRFGYRRFFLAGWGMRNICVFAVTTIPLFAFLDEAWKLGLLMAFQLIFNFLRGVSSGAWFPWITELLPQEQRARYIAREQRMMQLGCVLALVVSSAVLRRDSSPWEFSVVFLISAIGGASSLFFLNRVPDVHPHALKMSGTPVPWRSIVTFQPFVRLVGFNLLYMFTFGSIPVFAVSFLKARSGFGENQILLLNAAGFVAGVLSLPALGNVLDRIGSKRLLRWGLACLVLCVASWMAMAANLLSPGMALVAFNYIVGGAAGSATNLANVRLQMNTMPAMGRSHFFAFFTCFTSLCLGVTPIFWGRCIDLMTGLSHAAGAFVWNPYSVYFAGLLAGSALTLAGTAALNEEERRCAENTVPDGVGAAVES